MNINTNDIETINTLISVCKDGENFYQDAINSIEDVNLKNIFTENLNTRKRIVDELSAEIRLNGKEPSSSGTVFGNLRQVYAKLKKELSTKNDTVVIVEQLEEAEDRALEKFRTAVRDISEPIIESKVASALVSIQETHEKMRSLKAYLN